MQDPLLNNEEKNKDQNNTLQNKDKFYFVMSYIPLLQFVFIFSDIPKSTELKKHMSQGITLFISYIILTLVIGIFLPDLITKLIGIFYFLFSIYLAGNAYNGIYINIPFLNELEKIFMTLISSGKNKSDKD